MLGRILLTYEMEPEGQGTRLRLRSRGLGGPEQERFFPMAKAGFIQSLERDHLRLVEVLRTTRP